MLRRPSSTVHGGSFDYFTVQAVWDLGRTVSGYDSSEVRQDVCGFFMIRSEYGKTSRYGWEIDHKRPVSKGGGDSLANLQPLHWRNNRSKGDSYPTWYYAVRV
jgi:hypothetical protein